MFSVVISFLALSSSVVLAAKIEKRSTSKCYGDLGCFSIAGPFVGVNGPIFLFPDSPEEINTRFKLHTRQDQSNTSFEYLVANDPESIKNSNFSTSRQTKIIVHGFTENSLFPWVPAMKDELLLNGDYNVILVDFESGAKFPYDQAVANTVVVGAEIARLINTLQVQVQATPETFHLIGLSLGAHIAGYAGQRTLNLSRISGLDPAGPYFDGKDPSLRLDPTDADFVDVIHTNADSLITRGLGTTQACGHVDYWVNGGDNQPGCPQLFSLTNLVLTVTGIDPSEAQEIVSDCSHRRSEAYFTESINSICPFEGYQCPDYQRFKEGLCLPCRNGECGFMGFYADLTKPSSAKQNVAYYLDTGDSQPFCRFQYQIRVTLGKTNSFSSQEVKIYMNLIGVQGEELGERQLTSEYITVEPGQTYGFLVTSAEFLGSLDRTTFKWISRRRLLKVPSPLIIKMIDIVNGETNLRHKFCGSGAQIDDDTTYTFNKMCSYG